jgi:hypothetical protein
VNLVRQVQGPAPTAKKWKKKPNVEAKAPSPKPKAKETRLIDLRVEFIICYL